MYCKKCGNELKQDVRFCSRCGERVDIAFKDKNVSIVDNRKAAFSLIFSLFPFLMFFIPIQVTLGSFWSRSYLIIDGYDSFSKWKMLSIWWGEGSNAIAIVNICILLFSLVLVLSNLFAIIGRVNIKNLYYVSGFLSLFFSLLYCLEGVILVVLCDSRYEPVTFSYFAVILVSFIAVAEWLMQKYIR